ncbi:MAG: right-handed parallel beta-helix repeat-containing protein [Phycisphaerales bacterium]
MHTHAKARFATVAAATLIALAGFTLAGPLNPPVGPVASTMKPLSEVEPRIAINASNTPGDNDAVFKISQPGSYYLTGNIQGVAGKHGIEILAADVTLDLNGFTLAGTPASLSGVWFSGSSGHVEVRNGVIKDWGNHGINLRTQDARSSVVRDIRAMNNAFDGIWTSQDSEIVDSCCAGNGGKGIHADADCMILRCTSRGNGGEGISTDRGCIVEGCTVQQNGSAGISAIGASCTITSCTSTGNAGAGVATGSYTIVSDVTVNSNGTYGFVVGSYSRVERCTATLNTLESVRITGSNTEVHRCTLSTASGFPVVSIDNVGGVSVTDCKLAFGTYAVQGPLAGGGFIAGNHCASNTSGLFNVGASFKIGPVVADGGTIQSVSPFANFDE